MIVRHTLLNGLRVVVEEVDFVRSVSMGIWIATGSRDETPETGGISHFLEHMFFKGTHSKSARELAEAFDFIGGQVNAFTTKEYTCLHAKVLDHHFGLALETLAEMLLQSAFSPEEMEREKRVILEEIKMVEDDPEESVHDLIVEECFFGHGLGASILGRPETLAGISQDDLLGYIRDRYTPDNLVIAVSGHVDSGEAIRTVERLFGGMAGNRKETASGAPDFSPRRTFRERPSEQAHVCLGSSAYAVDDDRSYPLILLNNILGGSSSSRLFQEIREERGMAYSVFSYHTSFRDAGLFAVYFGSTPAQAEQVLDLVFSTMDRIRTDGVSDREIEKAKNQVVGSLLLSLESISSRMTRIAKNELLLGRQVELDETIRRVEGVTHGDIATVADEVLAQPFACAALGPSESRTEYFGGECG